MLVFEIAINGSFSRIDLIGELLEVEVLKTNLVYQADATIDNSAAQLRALRVFEIQFLIHLHFDGRIAKHGRHVLKFKVSSVLFPRNN